MNHGDENKDLTNKNKYGEPASGRENESAKITNVARAFRAITAVVVFGIPLATGAAALIIYGVHKAYKRITGGS